MSSNLVRIFTCTSVIALSGATAAASMLACGGDDPPADDGTSSSSSSGSSGTSGKTSTSSSSSSSGSSAATCDPSGTYEFPSAVYEGKDGVCPKLAQGYNGQPASTYTYAKKPDGTYSETPPMGAANVLKIDPDSGGLCALTTGQGDTGSGPDLDGKTVKIELSGQVKVFFKDDEAQYAGVIDVTSSTPDAKGFPCTMTFKTTGKKK